MYDFVNMSTVNGVDLFLSVSTGKILAQWINQAEYLVVRRNSVELFIKYICLQLAHDLFCLGVEGLL